MGKPNNFWDSFQEVLWIAKSTITTFWFWLPIIYMTYVFVQLWLMFFVHPLTLAILPIVLIIYGIHMENKRINARYGLGKVKRISGTHGLGASPEPLKKTEWKVEQAVDRYRKLLRSRKDVEETE